MTKLIHMHADINVSPLNMSINMEGWTRKWIAKACGLKTFGTAVTIVKDHGMEFCFDPSFFKAQKNVKEKLLDNTLSLKEAEENLIRLGNEIMAISMKNEEKIEKLSDKELEKLFLELFEKGAELCDYGYIAVFADFPESFLSSELERILEKYSAKQEVVFLSQSSMKRPMNTSREEILQLIANKGDIAKWLKKWHWMDFGHLGPGYNLEHVNSEYKEYINNPMKAKQELERTIKENKELKQKQENRFKELGLSKKEIDLFHQSQDISFLKAYRTDILNCINAFFDRIFEKYSKKLGLSKDMFRFSKKEEVIDMIIKGIKIDEKTIIQRRKYSIWISNNEGIKVLIGKEAKEYVKKNIIFQKEEISTDSIKGNIAFPGIISGKARIVHNKSDMNKVLEGDIIIAVQTTPELLPAMKLAGAFITDIGGITCHAAIVARELKKPCIVGTKNATKILKDGDLIELDADKGVVRILENARG